MKYLGILLTALVLSACASKEVNKNGLVLVNEEGYENMIDKWSDHVEDYSGLNNTVTIMATLLNPEMAMSQLDQNARIFQWDQITYDNEKKKLQDAMKVQTDVFVSFYSPERKWDDLYKSKTLWKIFLDVNGQRYEGKVTKVKLLTREIQRLYSYHTSFGTPYIITFPVPANSVGTAPARITFTGAVGSVSLNFGQKAQ